MPEIKSRKYICDICGSENDITYNRGTIQIENEKHETRKCHCCDTQYRYTNNLLYLIPKQVGKRENAGITEYTETKKDSSIGNALVLMLFGGIALTILIGIFLVVDYAMPTVSKFGETAKNTVMNTVDSSPYLKFEDNKLYIDEFEYSFGVIEINKASGDFEKLNEKVFDLLIKEKGTCGIYVKVKSIDKYGNETEAYQYKGTIDIDEMRKFKNATFWAKSGGMQKLLIH